MRSLGDLALEADQPLGCVRDWQLQAPEQQLPLEQGAIQCALAEHITGLVATAHGRGIG